eukprot:4803509-Prymnesium_polylepis.1
MRPYRRRVCSKKQSTRTQAAAQAQLTVTRHDGPAGRGFVCDLCVGPRSRRSRCREPLRPSSPRHVTASLE